MPTGAVDSRIGGQEWRAGVEVERAEGRAGLQDAGADAVGVARVPVVSDAQGTGVDKQALSSNSYLLLAFFSEADPQIDLLLCSPAACSPEDP